jgi:hypothetical protein
MHVMFRYTHDKNKAPTATGEFETDSTGILQLAPLGWELQWISLQGLDEFAERRTKTRVIESMATDVAGRTRRKVNCPRLPARPFSSLWRGAHFRHEW